MSAHGPDLSPVIAGTPRTVPPRVRMLGLLAVAVGIAAVVLGVFTDLTRLRIAFVVDFVYFAGVAQGALMLAVVATLTNGRWQRPLKRIAEGLGLFMVVMYVLLLVFLLTGGLDIYPWMHEPMPAHKAIYLTPGFFIARQVVGLGLLLLIGLLYTRASLRPDLGVVADRIGHDKAPAWWGRLTGGWQGEEIEVAEGMRRQAALAPITTILFAFVFSMMVIDLSMSLAPYWYANMFPAWYFTSCFWSGLVYIGITAHLAKRWLGIEYLLPPNIFHDLGKLTFAFTMFWGYTLFAQYLAIWYGNMTEEIGFILLRTEIEPWASLSKVVAVMCFVMPFGMLLSRGLKKIPSAYLTVTTLIAIGLWLERFLVVVPSVWTGDTLPIGPIEIGMFVGLLGGLVLVVTKFLASVPPVPVTDPYMMPHPEDIHVHPSSSHAHAR